MRRTHGMSARKTQEGRWRPTKTYTAWQAMKSRCDNPQNISFKNYGARGVTYCERWREFSNFLADMGEKPTPKSSLDRIDGTKGYQADNCRWADRSVQNRNRRISHLITINGETLTLAEWEHRYSISHSAVAARLSRGWDEVRAVTTPMLRQPNGSRGKTLEESTKGIWYEMCRRCSNPKDHSYKNYGARGIQVCDLWASSFDNFVSDVGVRPDWEHTLDRINSEGNYEPGNVRWATRFQQSNNRRGRKTLTLNGRTDAIANWSRATGISTYTINNRLKAGWTVERTLTAPVQGKKS